MLPLKGAGFNRRLPAAGPAMGKPICAQMGYTPASAQHAKLPFKNLVGP